MKILRKGDLCIGRSVAACVASARMFCVISGRTLAYMVLATLAGCVTNDVARIQALVVDEVNGATLDDEE